MPINPIVVAPGGFPTSLPQDNRVISSISYDVFLEGDGEGDEAEAIGFITNLSDAYNRNNQKIRHLSTGDGGKVIEIVPGLEDITVNVTGFSLYNTGKDNRKNLGARLSGVAGLVMLSQNSEYFSVRVTTTHPNPPDAIAATTGIIYRRCLLKSMNNPRDINQIAQAATATLDVSWVSPSSDV